MTAGGAGEAAGGTGGAGEAPTDGAGGAGGRRAAGRVIREGSGQVGTERGEDGLRVRTEVMGDEYVQRSLHAVTDFRRPLLELVTEYGWGAVWGRPGLSRQSRSLVTIAAMAATGHQDELRVHVRGALRNGVSPEELQETLLQIAVYCGVPAAAEAFATVESALADLAAEDGAG